MTMPQDKGTFVFSPLKQRSTKPRCFCPLETYLLSGQNKALFRPLQKILSAPITSPQYSKLQIIWRGNVAKYAINVGLCLCAVRYVLCHVMSHSSEVSKAPRFVTFEGITRFYPIFLGIIIISTVNKSISFRPRK
jgi:hypothetical protein